MYTAGFLSRSSVNLQWKIIFILIFVTGITLLNTNFMIFIERLHTTEVTPLLHKRWKLQFRQNELSPTHSCFSCHPFPVLKISSKMWENCWSTNTSSFSSLLPHWQGLLIVSSSIFCSGEWRWCTHLLFVWYIKMTWLWPRHVLETWIQNWLCYFCTSW